MTKQALMVLAAAVFLLGAAFAGYYAWNANRPPAYTVAGPETGTVLGLEYQKFAVTITRPEDAPEPYDLTGQVLREKLEAGYQIVIVETGRFTGFGAWESAIKLDDFKRIAKAILLELGRWGLLTSLPEIEEGNHYYYIVIAK
jgi:hypothetical protein